MFHGQLAWSYKCSGLAYFKTVTMDICLEDPASFFPGWNWQSCAIKKAFISGVAKHWFTIISWRIEFQTFLVTWLLCASWSFEITWKHFFVIFWNFISFACVFMLIILAVFWPWCLQRIELCEEVAQIWSIFDW